METIRFLGPNGAGKTTALKMLSSILYPTSGSVSINAFTLWKRSAEFKSQISIVMGQKNQLWWDLPVSDSDYRDIVTELTELLDVWDLMNV